MTDTTQILLFAVVIVLTILTVIIGWQIFQILYEIRKMLMKLNSLVDGVVSTSANIGKSLQNINGFTAGLKATLGLFNIFNKDKKENG